MRLRWRLPPPADDFDEVAQSVERVATLLAAGVPAQVAWQHAALDPSTSPVGEAAAQAIRAGRSAAESIAATASADSAWRVVAAAWMVAEQGGAPAAASLSRLSDSLRDDAQARREVTAALAGPVASARLVAWLPLVAVLLGSLLGFDTVRVLMTTPIGVVCAVAGAALLLFGARWCARLARAARGTTTSSGLRHELLAIALGGGASLPGSRSSVDRALRACGVLVVDDDDSTADDAAAMGAPIGPLLRAEASRKRRVARAEASARAAKLGVRLLVPLGVCTLPAFVLLGVVPMLLAVITDTFAAT